MTRAVRKQSVRKDLLITIMFSDVMLRMIAEALPRLGAYADRDAAAGE